MVVQQSTARRFDELRSHLQVVARASQIGRLRSISTVTEAVSATVVNEHLIYNN
jgi:hypothetical protein